MPNPNHTGDGQGHKWRAHKGVGDATVMLKVGYRSSQPPENIKVGCLGRQRHGQRGVGRPAIEAGAGKACSGQEMGNRFHRVVSCLSSFMVGRKAVRF
jgi:hypothetical protein